MDGGRMKPIQERGESISSSPMRSNSVKAWGVLWSEPLSSNYSRTRASQQCKRTRHPKMSAQSDIIAARVLPRFVRCPRLMARPFSCARNGRTMIPSAKERPKPSLHEPCRAPTQLRSRASSGASWLPMTSTPWPPSWRRTSCSNGRNPKNAFAAPNASRA